MSNFALFNRDEVVKINESLMRSKSPEATVSTDRGVQIVRNARFSSAEINKAFVKAQRELAES